MGNESEPCIYMNATGTITIPEQAMGYTVNKISNYAFSRCSITFLKGRELGWGNLRG